MAHTFLFNLLIILGSATLVATIFHAFKVPTIVAFLAAGVLIGPNGLALVSTLPEAQSVAELGIIFLLFTLGLEFSFRRLKELRRPFLGLGLPQVVFTNLLASLTIHYGLHVPWSKAIFFGGLVALSSTATVLKMLQEDRALATPYGENSIGILLFQDIAVIPMILALPAFHAKGLDFTALSLEPAGTWLVQTLAFVLLVWITSRVFIPFLLNRVVHTKSRELFFFSIIFILFGIATLFEALGLSLSLGAFVAGVLISESPYGKQATSDLGFLRDNFLSLFFISIGMLLDIRFLASHILEVLSLVGLLIFLKSGLIYLLGRIHRYPHNISLFSALMLFQVGEFSFILAESGMSLGLFTPDELQYFLAASILSLGLTPVLYKLAPQISFKQNSKALLSFSLSKSLRGKVPTPPRETTPAKTLLIGFGVAGQHVAAALKTLEIPYRIVELNAATVKDFAKLGEPIHFGDATRVEILEAAGIETAPLAVITISGSQVIQQLVSAMHRIRPDLHIIVRIESLREAAKISDRKNVEVVVGEFETSLEVLARTLSHYGASSPDIHRFIVEARKNISASHGAFGKTIRKNIELPTWEALSAINPFWVKPEHVSVGKTIAEVSLRRLTGSNIVLVYREGLGSKIPGSDFILEAGDVLYLIGTPDSLKLAETLLSHGESPTPEP